MVRACLPIAILLAVGVAATAQERVPKPDPYCGASQVMEAWLNIPENRNAHEAFEARMYQSASQRSSRQSGAILPVVIHIVHANGSENIPDAQILSGIEHLNEAFAYQGAYPASGPGLNTDISFCLARQDPQGNPTSGITRTVSPYTSMTIETEDVLLKDVIRWDPTRYINVWVVKEISSSIAGPGVAGYAYFPSSHGSGKDGIVLEAVYFGSSPSSSSVLIHEMGHYLGLYHTFEGGCPNDDCLMDGDRICDTPPDKSTAHVACSGSVNTCSTDVLSGFFSDEDDFIWDFMDYSKLECYSGFTQDQSARMHSVIDLVRNSLLQGKACQDPCLTLSPVEILGPQTPVDVGTTLTFNQVSSGATAWQWRINGIPLGNGASQDYLFDQVGTYIISVEATNADPNCFRQDTVQVHVVCPVNAQFTYTLNADQSVTLTSMATGNIGSHQWEATQQSMTTTIGQNTPSLTHVFTEGGWTTICLTISPPNDLCASTFCQNLFIPDTSALPQQLLSRYQNPNSVYFAGNRYHPQQEAFYCPGSEWTDSQHLATLTKIDPCGEVIWSRSYAEDTGFAYLSEVVIMSDGNLLVCGGHSPSGNSMDETSNFFLKLDAADGAVIWSKKFSHSDRLTGIRMVPSLNDPAGECYYIAHWIHKGGFADDGALIKIDQDGNVIWNRRYVIPNSDFEISAIKPLPFGKLALFGQTGTPYRAHVVLINPDGSIQLSKFYTGPGVITCSFRSGEWSLDGSFLVHGFINTQKTNGQDKDWFIAKLSSNLDLIWMDRYQTPWSMDGGESLRLSDGSVMFLTDVQVGSDRSPAYIRTDDQGSIQQIRLLDESWPASQTPQPRLSISSTNTLAENIVLGLERRLQDGSSGLLAAFDPDEDPCLVSPTSLPLTTTSLSETTMNLVAMPFTYQWSSMGPSTDRMLTQSIICGTSPCVEDCSNGLDDDQNGLIDCFDPACPCTTECLDHYYQDCPNDCQTQPGEVDYAMLSRWETTLAASGTPAILAGNLYGEGPNIIVTQPGQSTITILDGLTGGILHIFPTPNDLLSGSMPAIGDIDHDGTAELFVVDASNHLAGFEHDGSLRFISSQPVNISGIQGQSSIHLADLNEDGTPEICIGTSIFNASTGELLVMSNPLYSSGSHPDLGENLFNGTAIGDILPSESCPSCSGLEMVCGNQLLGVSQDNQALSLLTMAGNGLPDGITSLADIDLDGDVDGVVVTAANNLAYCYAWDLQTDQVIGTYSFPTNGTGTTRVAIGDVDGDQLPDLVLVAAPRLMVLDNTLNLKWERSVPDLTSLSIPVLFDLGHSGSRQIIVQGDQALYILDGASGATLSDFPCHATLHLSSPILADCNMDGQAEIITCTMDAQNEYAVLAISSPTASWAATRSVWNQAAFHNTHIEEDLDVPIVYQPHALVTSPPSLNTYLSATTIPSSHSPDADINALEILCHGDSMRIILQYCNSGTGNMPTRIPMTLYAGDVTLPSAIPIGTYVIESPLRIDSCETLFIDLPKQPDGLYSVVVNDTGNDLPPIQFAPENFTSGIRECHYQNNLDTFRIAFTPPVLDLGPDTSMCDLEAFPVAATPGFAAYTWHSGWTESTWTVEHPGIAWVDAIDLCGQVQRDSLSISLVPTPDLISSTDTTVCEGSILEFNLIGLTNVQWFLNDTLILSQSGTLTMDPAREGLLVVTGQYLEGCVVSDSLRIHILPLSQAEVPIFLCPGDSLVLDGQMVTNADTLVSISTNSLGCDSVIRYIIHLYPEIVFDLDIEHSCDGVPGQAEAIHTSGTPPFETLWFDPQNNPVDPEQLAPGIYQVLVRDQHQCQRLDTFVVQESAPPSYEIMLSPITCHGWQDGQIQIMLWSTQEYEIYLNGIPLPSGHNPQTYGTGTYAILISDTLGCRFTDTVTLLDPPPIIISLPGDTAVQLGSHLNLAPEGSIPSGIFAWSPADILNCPTCEQVMATPLESGWITLQYTNPAGCRSIDSMYIEILLDLDIFIPNAFSPNDDGINDVFAPYFPDAVKSVLAMEIYDRWGELVHLQTHIDPLDPALGWNGQFREKLMDPGIFVYKFDLALINDQQITLSGEVHLIR